MACPVRTVPVNYCCQRLLGRLPWRQQRDDWWCFPKYDSQTQSTEEVRPEDEEVNRAQSKEMFLNVYTAAERTQTRLKHEVHVILKHICHLSCLQIQKTTKKGIL